MLKYLVSLISVTLVFTAFSDPIKSLDRRTGTKSTMYVTCPLHNDTNASGDTLYTDSAGLTFNGGDYTGGVTSAIMHGLLLEKGTGNLSVEFEGGGTKIFQNLVVDSGKVVEILRGYRIKTIDSLKTNFTGAITPLF